MKIITDLPATALTELLQIADVKGRTLCHLVAGDKLYAHQLMAVLLKFLKENGQQGTVVLLAVIGCCK